MAKDHKSDTIGTKMQQVHKNAKTQEIWYF